MTLLDWALEWAERGIPVFPLRPRDKVPITQHGVKDATQDATQIRAWWAKWPDANIGGATGSACGRWVLDVDGSEGAASLAALLEQHGDLPTTTTVATARGRHIWFMVPWVGVDPIQIRNSAGKVGPGLDVRGDGGYVVMPPSVHPSGAAYQLIEDVQADDAPDWLVKLVTAKPKPRPSQQPDLPSTNAADRILGMARKAAERIRAAPEGTRNDTLNRECFGLGGFLAATGLDSGLILHELEAAAINADQDPACVTRALNDGRNHPRPMPEDRPPPSAPKWTAQPQEPERPPPEPDVAALARLPHTDLGNAARFVERHGEDVRWCKQRDDWLLWLETHWWWDDGMQAQARAQQTAIRIEDEVRHFEQLRAELPPGEDDQTVKRRTQLEELGKAAKKHALSSQGSGRIAAMLTEARPRRAVRMDQLDRNPYLLVARNVTIDLQTMQTREHRREDMVTRCLSVEYHPDATCPRWVEFVDQVLPNESVRHMVQRALGQSLTGDVSEQRWYLLTGEGSNGKSTLLETFRELLGRYATTLPAGFLEQKKYEQHATEMVDLQGARFAVGSEPQGEARWDAERIKRLTGGERQKARPMRQDFYEFDPTAKLWVAANRRPSTTDTTHGFWRRLVIVPFDVQIAAVDRDARLRDKLALEFPGILNWCIEGYRDFRDVGLQVPEACELAVSEYQQEQDHVARFVAERCVVEDGAHEISGRLYTAFQRWHTDQGLSERPLSAPAFGKRLAKVPKLLSYNGSRKVRMWSGIRLTETVAQPEVPEDWHGEN